MSSQVFFVLCEKVYRKILLCLIFLMLLFLEDGIFVVVVCLLLLSLMVVDVTGLYRLSVVVDVAASSLAYLASGPAITFLIKSSYLMLPSKSSCVSVYFKIWSTSSSVMRSPIIVMTLLNSIELMKPWPSRS